MNHCPASKSTRRRISFVFAVIYIYACATVIISSEGNLIIKVEELLVVRIASEERWTAILIYHTHRWSVMEIGSSVIVLHEPASKPMSTGIGFEWKDGYYDMTWKTCMILPISPSL